MSQGRHQKQWKDNRFLSPFTWTRTSDGSSMSIFLLCSRIPLAATGTDAFGFGKRCVPLFVVFFRETGVIHVGRLLRYACFVSATQDDDTKKKKIKS
ncbi:hypothetical protein CEXT_323091 [Caerostris extrusa]|uniref:Uncharacterized protein n=1 Tax=Caerostris extrusa TaxID=172846 RepID=A0AAV4N3E1_CAEEX|nr:hypothetical protein CEXT_323091 [Caerostris extrusa]